MEFGGKEIKYDERGEQVGDVVTPSGLRQDGDGHLMIDAEAAERAIRIEVAKLRSVLRISNHEPVDLADLRRAALDFATRGAAGSALALTVIERAQAFERYLTTGDV